MWLMYDCLTWKKIPVVALYVVQQQLRREELISCVAPPTKHDHHVIHDYCRVKVLWLRLKHEKDVKR